MATKLSFRYDREGDILYIDKCPPYPEQESEEQRDDVIARVNPRSGSSKRSLRNRRVEKNSTSRSSTSPDRHGRTSPGARIGVPEGSRKAKADDAGSATRPKFPTKTGPAGS
jgi:uncharacterized protein DUF2283